MGRDIRCNAFESNYSATGAHPETLRLTYVLKQMLDGVDAASGINKAAAGRMAEVLDGLATTDSALEATF